MFFHLSKPHILMRPDLYRRWNTGRRPWGEAATRVPKVLFHQKQDGQAVRVLNKQNRITYLTNPGRINRTRFR